MHAERGRSLERFTDPDYAREHFDLLAGAMAPLALDRHRVVHAAAFRRLMHKTQVFVAGDGGDHFRTRLTHTLEVAALAQRLAVAAELDAALAEVVALTHDLGHPPFGHAGEKALAACLADAGGFEHNRHALRVVEYLEHPYPGFRGLNLTRVVRECLVKHETAVRREAHGLDDGAPAPLEGQLVDLADRLTYLLHDLQDGVYAGLVDAAALSELSLWADARERFGEAGTAGEARRILRPVCDQIELALVEDVALEVQRRVGRRPPARAPGAVALSAGMARAVDDVERLVRARVYRNQRVIRMDAKAARIVTALFEAYTDEPGLMPARFVRRVDEQGAARVAADYIAGMTDRYCMEEHARLFDPRSEV